MPRYLALFTADQLTPPTREHIEHMGRYVEQQARAGRLIATGGLKQRARDGFAVRRKGDNYKVAEGGAPWAAATGYAILEAPSREAFLADIKEFLGLAGDGVPRSSKFPQAARRRTEDLGAPSGCSCLKDRRGAGGDRLWDEIGARSPPSAGCCAMLGA
jgi:hypothetical protein